MNTPFSPCSLLSSSIIVLCILHRRLIHHSSLRFVFCTRIYFTRPPPLHNQIFNSPYHHPDLTFTCIFLRNSLVDRDPFWVRIYSLPSPSMPIQVGYLAIQARRQLYL